MLYDTIIIGSGPAALTASIYASRYKLAHLIIGKQLGGTITLAHKVENFPGLPGISGFELGQRIARQAESFGVEILAEFVAKINISEVEGRKSFQVITETNKEFIAKTLIVATGTERRKLNVPGEKKYLGRGVSYCTNCDIPFFKDKTVVLVGGANAACSGAVHAAEFAQKVYLIYRKEELRAEPFWIEEVKNNPKIEVIYRTNITEILGDGSRVTAVGLDNPYQGAGELKTDGVFVEIGGIPASSFLVPLGVELDKDNYVKVNEKMETNVAGLFAAGDVTDKNIILPQTITACSQGAIAAYSVFNYLKTNTSFALRT